MFLSIKNVIRIKCMKYKYIFILLGTNFLYLYVWKLYEIKFERGKRIFFIFLLRIFYINYCMIRNLYIKILDRNFDIFCIYIVRFF